MKFIPKLVTASAASLLLASASQAALISVNIDVAGTIAGLAAGTSNGAYSGTYNDATGQILASGTTNPLTAYTDATVGSSIDVTGLVGTNTVTSCTNNGAPLIDLCLGNVGYGVPAINDSIGIPSAMPLTSNSVDSSGNGVFTTVDMSNPSATVSLTYTVAAVPVPAAAWLFGSALLGLTGVARRRKAGKA